MGSRRNSWLSHALRTAFLVAVLAMSGVFAGATSLVVPPVRAAGAGEALMGDVDCSGAVNLADALALRRSAAGILPNPSCIVLASDVTCDNDVDATDVLALLRSLAGLAVSVPGGCVTVGEEVGASPTSSELIAAALAANDIDVPTALVYGVFAAYGDPRLPAQFHGDDSTTPTSLDVARAYENWSSLSPEQQGMLAPYMLPPSAAGSWYDDSGDNFGPLGFSSLISTLVPVVGTPGIRIWVDASFPSQALADLSTTLSQVLTTTKISMNRAPLDDSSASNNGGDGALDVYVVPGLAAKALAKWYEPNACKNGPMFVEIDALSLPSEIQPHSGGFAGALQTIAHVLTEATAGGVNTPGAQQCVFGEGFRWAVQATGALTEHLSYPDVNSEHRWDEIFETPHISLPEFEEGGQSLWMLLEHLSETNSSVVSQLWTQAETSDSALGALAASANLEEAFPAFMLELLNEGPNNHFSLIHNITKRVVGNTGMPGGGGLAPLAINLAGQSSVALSTALTSLDAFSAQHYRFTVTDPEVKSIGISNLIHGIAGTTIQAMGKDGAGPWTALQLDASPLHSICLADAGSHLTDLVVVLTNSDAENQSPAPFADEPLVEARNSCGFTGSITYTRHEHCDVACTVSEESETGDLFFTFTSNDLVFTRSTTDAPDQEFYLLESGTISVSMHGQVESCSYSGNDIITLAPGKGAIRIQNKQDGSVDYALYGFFQGEPGSTFTYNGDCGGGPVELTREVGFWMCSGGARSSSSPNLLSGAYHFEAQSLEAALNCPGTSQALPPLNFASGPNAVPGQARDYSWNLRR